MIKVSLVLLAGLMGAAAARSRSAALRHWILASAILCAAAMPVLELAVPALRVPFSAAWLRDHRAPLALVVPIDYASAGASTEASVAPGAGLARWPLTPGALARNVWAAGAAVCLGFVLVGLVRLAWIRSRSHAIDRGPWADALRVLSQAMGVGRGVRIFQSDHPSLLATWGYRRASLMLPAGAGEWPGPRIRVVLAHELAHVRRGDWATQLVSDLLRSVYWFNPLVWIACRQLRRESEQACDDRVLDIGVEPPVYAAHLLELARAFAGHRRLMAPAPAMAQRSLLERRVRVMLNEHHNRRPITRRASLATLVALLALAVPIAGLIAWAQDGPASFSGALMDATGRMLPDMPIVLASVPPTQIVNVRRQTDTATGTIKVSPQVMPLKYEARTDASGRFEFSGVVPGDYRVEVSKPGFQTIVAHVALAKGQRLEQDLALQVGKIAETVFVSAVQGAAAAPSPARVLERSASPDPCSQSSEPGCIAPPAKLVDRAPTYPQAQADRGVSGKGVVSGRLGADGYVKDLVAAPDTDPEFAAATIEAVQSWRFSPVRLNGVPVECGIQVTVIFQIKR